MADERQDERPVAGLDRIVFFSDAVMAIAITLIVVQISVPRVSDSEIGAALSDGWPEYISFLLSFWVIGIYWFWHHVMFRSIVRYDTVFIWLNLLFLLCVAFLPFPTAVLGEYGNESPAVVAYAATITLTGMASAALWWYATRDRRLVSRSLSDEDLRLFRRRSLVTPLVFAASIPIAVVHPTTAKLVWILSFIVPRLLTTLHERRVRATS